MSATPIKVSDVKPKGPLTTPNAGSLLTPATNQSPSQLLPRTPPGPDAQTPPKASPTGTSSANAPVNADPQSHTSATLAQAVTAPSAEDNKLQTTPVAASSSSDAITTTAAATTPAANASSAAPTTTSAPSLPDRAKLEQPTAAASKDVDMAASTSNNASSSADVIADAAANATAKENDTGSAAQADTGAQDNDVAMGDAEAADENKERPPCPDDAKPELTIIYSPGGSVPDLSKHINQLVEFQIPAHDLRARNEAYLGRQLWGTDIYTDDSDIVAILTHTSHIAMRGMAPSKYGISAVFRVLPGQSSYVSMVRHSIKSRSWAPKYHKCSLQLVRCTKIESRQIEERRDRVIRDMQPRRRRNERKRKLQDVVLMGGAEDSAMRSKKAQTRPRMFGASIIFTNDNEPWLKYSMSLIGDRGLSRSRWTSYRLKSQVLYLMGKNTRYELAREPASDHQRFDTYRWAEVPPTSYTYSANMFNKIMGGASQQSKRQRGRTKSRVRKTSTKDKTAKSVPLKSNALTVLEEHVDWAEIEWGQNKLAIRGRTYPVFAHSWVDRSA